MSTSSIKMNLELARSKKEQFEMAKFKICCNHTWTRKRTTSYFSTSSLLLLSFSSHLCCSRHLLFSLQLCLKWPSLKLKSSLYQFTLSIPHIFSALTQTLQSQKNPLSSSIKQISFSSSLTCSPSFSCKPSPVLLLPIQQKKSLSQPPPWQGGHVFATHPMQL